MTAAKGAGTRFLLAVVVSAILVSVLNQTFTNVVVPDIQDDFGASRGQTGWVITGYLLVFAVGIPLYGRIADLYSLRLVFSVGLVVLAAGSLVCALAPTLPVLVAGRIVQAVGASAIPALGFAAVAKAMPPGERGAALGLLSSSVGAGAAVGPVAGGAIAGLAGWHVLFYLTLVLSLALAPAALRVLPGAPETDGAPTGLCGGDTALRRAWRALPGARRRTRALRRHRRTGGRLRLPPLVGQLRAGRRGGGLLRADA